MVSESASLPPGVPCAPATDGASRAVGGAADGGGASAAPTSPREPSADAPTWRARPLKKLASLLVLPPVVHPNSQFRRHWDAFTAFFALCALWQLPLGLVVSWWPSSPLGAFESSAAARLLNLWLDAWCVRADAGRRSPAEMRTETPAL